MVSNQRWAIPALAIGGRGADPDGALSANQRKNRSISVATVADGGASK